MKCQKNAFVPVADIAHRHKFFHFLIWGLVFFFGDPSGELRRHLAGYVLFYTLKLRHNQTRTGLAQCAAANLDPNIIDDVVFQRKGYIHPITAGRVITARLKRGVFVQSTRAGLFGQLEDLFLIKRIQEFGSRLSD